jgi:fructose-1-phosphate kinase PfkB-like protein
LPGGLPADAYAQLARLAARRGVRTLLDCDGPAFAAAVKAHPFLVKPNACELSQWQGRTLRTRSALRSAAENLSRATGGWVLVSQGPAGAILVHAKEDFFAAIEAPKAQPVNTLGAGDALLAAAAWQIEHEANPAEWLRQGVTIGSAATQCPAGCLPERAS